MAAYRVRVLPGGGLELTRNGARAGGAAHSGVTLVLRDGSRVHLLPPRERDVTKDRAPSKHCDSMSTAVSSPASASRRCWPSA